MKFDHETKALASLIDEAERHVSYLILAAYLGAEKALHKAASDDWKSRIDKLRGYIGRKFPKLPEVLTLHKFKKSMRKDDWDALLSDLRTGLAPHLDGLSEELAVKSVLLGMARAQQEEKGLPGDASLREVEKRIFSGYIPDTIRSVGSRYDLDAASLAAIERAHSSLAAHVTKIPERIRDAVREQVISGSELSVGELASNLFHIKDDRPDLKVNTAEHVARDWRRVAATELARYHDMGKTAALEGRARKEPVYMVFRGTGGCDWCRAAQGTVVRLLPPEQVGNQADDSLSSRGIEDPHTDIAVWTGKNNVGFKKDRWRICGTIHPWCGDGLTRIDPEMQEYDPESDAIRWKDEGFAESFVPPEYLKEIDDLKAKKQMREDLKAADRAAGVHARDARYV